MELERKKALLIRICYYFFFAVSAYVALRYLWRLLLPFLLGFVIAYMLRPVVGFISRNSKISRRSASIICAIIFYVALGALCWLLGAFSLLQLEEIGRGLPRLYTEKIEPSLSLINDKFISFTEKFLPNLKGEQVYASINEALNNIFVSASTWGMGAVTDLMKSIPMAIITLIFTMVSSVLICADYDGVTAFTMLQIPQRLHSTILDVRDFLAKSILRILKAYLILMVITFALLALGLWLIGIERVIIYAAIIAFLDLLPVLGSGAVLIPWGVVLALTGQSFAGFGMILLWAVVSFIRELLEPKILGGQIGLHPLVALTAMYFGLKLAGFAGLILAPVICLLACYLHDNGVIKLYNKPDNGIDIK